MADSLRPQLKQILDDLYAIETTGKSFLTDSNLKKAFEKLEKDLKQLDEIMGACSYTLGGTGGIKSS
jgi:hypothetical protein